MQLSAASYHLIPLRSKYFPPHLFFSNMYNLCSSLNVTDHVSQSYKTGKIIITKFLKKFYSKCIRHVCTYMDFTKGMFKHILVGLTKFNVNFVQYISPNSYLNYRLP
jgi:hypothetical protein